LAFIICLHPLFDTALAQDFRTPEATFEAYKEAARDGDMQKYMLCTTKESQHMLASSPSSPVKLKNEFSALKDKQYTVDFKNDTATLLFVPEDPHCPPYFLVNEGGEWKLDLLAMSKKIYFDYDNKWHWREQ